MCVSGRSCLEQWCPQNLFIGVAKKIFQKPVTGFQEFYYAVVEYKLVENYVHMSVKESHIDIISYVTLMYIKLPPPGQPLVALLVMGRHAVLLSSPANNAS